MTKRRLLVCLAVLAAGVLLGLSLNRRVYEKSVAFRVSNREAEMDYDFAAALNYLKGRFESNGYKVLGTAYAGKLYPKELDKAGVNVYVRGFHPFYDLRKNERAVNVHYIHRMMEIYLEEMQGYDYYLSSQSGFGNAVKKLVKFDFLESGAVWHEALEPDYQTDVLYIYEYINADYVQYLKENLHAKIYSGRWFAGLSDKEREKELKRARLVVYQMEEVGADDADYVPYAVYDVISYGRPVLTNLKAPLERVFRESVFLFEKPLEMAEMTKKALELEDGKRELLAQEARKKLFANPNKGKFFLQ